MHPGITTCMQHDTCQACASPPSEPLPAPVPPHGTSTLQKKKTKWIEEPIVDVTISPKDLYKEDKEETEKVDWKGIEADDKKVREHTGTWGQGVVLGTGRLAQCQHTVRHRCSNLNKP